MYSARVPFLGAINCASTLADLSYKIEITDYSVLYHTYGWGVSASEDLLEGPSEVICSARSHS